MSWMFKQHKVWSFVAEFNPVPEEESGVPSSEFIERRIRDSLVEDNILQDLFDMGGKQPVKIGEIRITAAAYTQVRDMWWYARDESTRQLAPKIPLKYFTFMTERRDGKETISVEIHPGLDDWEPQ